MTFNKMNAHTNPIFIQLEFLKIEDIRQLQLLSFVYDCLNKTAPVFFHYYFTPSSERHTFNYTLMLFDKGVSYHNFTLMLFSDKGVSYHVND